jgi:hypothetical protein
LRTNPTRRPFKTEAIDAEHEVPICVGRRNESYCPGSVDMAERNFGQAAANELVFMFRLFRVRRPVGLCARR